MSIISDKLRMKWQSFNGNRVRSDEVIWVLSEAYSALFILSSGELSLIRNLMTQKIVRSRDAQCKTEESSINSPASK